MAGGGLWPLRGCARWGSLRKGWRVLGWHSGACAKDEQNGPQKGTGDLLGACDAGVSGLGQRGGGRVAERQTDLGCLLEAGLMNLLMMGWGRLKERKN